MDHPSKTNRSALTASALTGFGWVRSSWADSKLGHGWKFDRWFELRPELRPKRKSKVRPKLRFELKPELRLGLKPDLKPELKPNLGLAAQCSKRFLKNAVQSLGNHII